MIRTLHINGYRGLNRFTMEGLGQINLLVGTNNSGKTSVLEALFLLATGGDPLTLRTILNRRGERLLEDITPPSMSMRASPELDISHLFYGHELKIGTSFSISSPDTSEQSFICTARKAPESQEIEQESQSLFSLEQEESIGIRLALYCEGTPAVTLPIIPLSRSGSLGRAPQVVKSRENSPIYIATESVPVSDLVFLWDEISLTPAQGRVIHALQCVEPKVENIAPIASSAAYSGPGPGRRHQGGFKVKLSDIEKPLPIGTLGDGVWRMLALAIALSRAKDSVLLIDEIDTGLHYSVMDRMWKLVAETAKELNVQVFATTHSRDCIQSLATICHRDGNEDGSVSIQRLEPERGRAVAYTEAEIIAAAEHGIEVR